MNWSDSPTDKLDLQTVLYKVLMDLIATAGRIKLVPEMAENFYGQVRTLIAFVRPMLDDSAVDELNRVILESKIRWEKREVSDDPNDPLAATAAIMAKGDHTFYCAVNLLGTTMLKLNEKGIVRLQKKGGITGFGVADPETNTIRVTLDELSIEPPGEEEDDSE